MLKLSAPNIQLKEANRVIRLYIKSLRDKAVYRVEAPKKLQVFGRAGMIYFCDKCEEKVSRGFRMVRP